LGRRRCWGAQKDCQTASDARPLAAMTLAHERIRTAAALRWRSPRPRRCRASHSSRTTASGDCMNGIPVLHVEADCIARAWERSLIELHRHGCSLKTEYDKAEDPPSKDATMVITITDPLSEPMIHKDFPGGPIELQEYVMEVCEGIKDHLVRDPSIRGTPAGNTLSPAAVCLHGAHAPAGRPDRKRSVRSSPRRPIPAGPKPPLGRCGKTTPVTTRPACRASGVGSSSRRQDRC